MITKQIYYEDTYKKELDCEVISAEVGIDLTEVVLDQTIFYPEGGGQPSDQGKLEEAKVVSVRLIDGEIVHQVKGDLAEGQKVRALIDWERRYKFMKIHSAGHLLHDHLVGKYESLIPLKGNHGKKSFIEYEGSIEGSKEDIEKEVNDLLNRDLIIVTKVASFDELKKLCKFVPENLPKNKPLRMIQIGDFAPMPDGGVHVRSTKEIGKILIYSIDSDHGKVNVRYGVS
ncbi:MAG: alanyl-tRNA editing protein [Candidatus Dojkabacteria bacterium]|nr:alanyl-tRNA editing protein [Candidatus Dojkabacteria bacterium]